MVKRGSKREFRPGFDWTQDELSELKRMYESNDYEVDQIVELLGRSHNSIRLKASRMGWFRPVTQYRGTIKGEPIKYDPETNTLTVLQPVDIDEVLNYICEVLTDKARWL